MWFASKIVYIMCEVVFYYFFLSNFFFKPVPNGLRILSDVWSDVSTAFKLVIIQKLQV